MTVWSEKWMQEQKWNSQFPPRPYIRGAEASPGLDEQSPEPS